MPNILNYSLQISLYYRFIAHCTLLFLKTYSNLLSILGKAPKNIVFFSPSTQNPLKYTLQNRAYSQMHSTYTLEVLKSSLNIQKSTQKHLKALVKHPLHLLFSMLTELFLAFFNTATTLLAQLHIINPIN